MMTGRPRRATWRTWTALGVVAVAAALDWWWVWGVWMLYYAVTGLRSGEAFLVEPIAREASPVPFWIITGMWAAFGFWVVAADLYLGSPW